MVCNQSETSIQHTWQLSTNESTIHLIRWRSWYLCIWLSFKNAATTEQRVFGPRGVFKKSRLCWKTANQPRQRTWDRSHRFPWRPELQLVSLNPKTSPIRLKTRQYAGGNLQKNYLQGAKGLVGLWKKYLQTKREYIDRSTNASTLAMPWSAKPGWCIHNDTTWISKKI